MNVKEFILSGVLESYVTGTASPEEIRKVQEMEKLYPEVKNEIEEIEANLMAYAEAYTKQPSEALRSRISQQIFKGKTGEAKIVQLNPESSSPNRILRIAVAASFAFFLISSLVNVILYGKLNDVKEELAELNSEKDVLAYELKVQQTTMSTQQTTIESLITMQGTMMKPGTKMVTLKGLDLSPSSAAMVVWNPSDKSVYMSVASLPPPPSGMQYQLWALMDGKPVDAGVFDLNANGAMYMQKMKDMPGAQAFAVTLEKAGGSPGPTMEAMYLMGSV